MRFAVVTLGSAGDLHPFLAVARALVERGHSVHLLSQAPHEAAVRAEGVGFRPIASARDHERTLRHPLLWHPLHGFGVLWRHLAVPAIGPTLEALDVLAGDASDGPLVVFASPLAVGARLAAERWPARLRLVSGYTAPMGLRHEDDPLFLGGWQVPAWLPPRLRPTLWRALDRWKLEPMARPALAQWRERLGLAHAANASTFGEWVHAPAGGLALYPDWFAAVPQAWRLRHVRQVGFPVFEPGATAPAPPELAAFLADPQPYVVAYPGSADQRGQRFADRVVAASQSLGCRTLVLSRHANGGEVPILGGATTRPEHRAGQAVLRLDEAPLGDVLPHAAAFVHHGGIGSLAQGLAAGIPQLVLASAYDQFENGARLSALASARWHREVRTSTEGVRRSLKALQAAPSFVEPLPRPQASRPHDPNPAVQRAAHLLEHMHDQFSLPGLAPESPPFPLDPVVVAGRKVHSYALFFALLPDPAEHARLAEVSRRCREADGVSGAVTAPERLHVTVIHVADYAAETGVPRQDVEAALAAGQDVREQGRLELDFTTAWTVPGGSRAYVLSCDASSQVEVGRLQGLLSAALKRRGLTPDRAVPAHMTLAYNSRPLIARHPIEPVKWSASRLALIISHRGLTHHQIVGEWILD